MMGLFEGMFRVEYFTFNPADVIPIENTLYQDALPQLMLNQALHIVCCKILMATPSYLTSFRGHYLLCLMNLSVGIVTKR
ncbi:hypothetical protein [uncultured Paraglaciecola sp.]|uniref:hypothetical protein n=1 Tax=uncultured Paraglaciecola sp. TaxID=1765024 RepID=UPI0026320167|nr:hypothetical protein [uncultured Paraglaciecola sp.]